MTTVCVIGPVKSMPAIFYWGLLSTKVSANIYHHCFMIFLHHLFAIVLFFK